MSKVRSVIGTMYKDTLSEIDLKDLYDKCECKFATG